MNKLSLLKYNLKNKFFLKTDWSFWKNLIWFVLIFVIAIISFSLMLCFDGRGFNFDKNFFLYKKMLIKIPIVGFCLGVSSYLIQHSSGNKMADTSILGIGNINSLFAIIMVTLLDLNSQTSINIYNTLLPFVFIAGSTLGSMLIYFLSYKKGKQVSKKFVLVGILINFFFVGLSTAVNSRLISSKQAIIKEFISGNMSELAGMDYLSICLIATIILFVWIMLIANKFKIVSTNPVIAKSLGINSNNITLQILIICGALTGVSYAMAGNLIFLGLVTGNIATSIFKKNIKFGVISTFVVSSIILCLTFWVFSIIVPTAANHKIPSLDTVNLISVMCIPYFIYLMFKE